MTAIQYLNISPGLSSQTQSQLTNMLQEISQSVSTVTVNLRRQRDAAVSARDEEHDRFKSAAEEAELFRKSMDELRKKNEELDRKVAHGEDREQLLKSHVKDLKQQLNHTRKQLETLTTDAVRFHAHHDKVVGTYKESDEKHFKTITVSQSWKTRHHTWHVRN